MPGVCAWVGKGACIDLGTTPLAKVERRLRSSEPFGSPCSEGATKQGNVMKKVLAAAAIAVAFTVGAPATAGEVTGKGDQIDAPGKSVCRFSGQNDGDDPPGRTQSFGQNVANGYPSNNPVDPTSLDPDGGFQRHPGWACNPNNFMIDED